MQLVHFREFPLFLVPLLTSYIRNDVDDDDGYGGYGGCGIRGSNGDDDNGPTQLHRRDHVSVLYPVTLNMNLSVWRLVTIPPPWPYKSKKATKTEHGGWGYTCAILSLGDINTGTWSSRLRVGHKGDNLTLQKMDSCEIQRSETQMQSHRFL
jgi:hypothetical protein